MNEIDAKATVSGTPSNGDTLIYDSSEQAYVPSAPSGGDVTDVQVNGGSVVSQGVANVPVADANTYGTVKAGDGSTYGVVVNSSGFITTSASGSGTIKTGNNSKQPITPYYLKEALYYGLAKLAGANMSSVTGETVGVYPEAQKSAISDMLNAPETISGSTPTINAKAGVRYICGEVATLSITAPASGCIGVVFTSGSTPTVLTVTSAKTGVTAIKWTGGFDPTSLDANTTYEINVLDGEFGVVGKWT